MTRLPKRKRVSWRIILVVSAAFAPLLIPGNQHVIRLACTVLAVVFAVKAWDLASDDSATALPPIRFVIHLFNPFSLAQRLVLADRKPTAASDCRSILLNSAFGFGAVILALEIFRIDWARHPAFAERCAKTFAIFFAIHFIPNVLAALGRRVGIDSTDFCKPFILARTPAEFWRFYNRPAEQFFRIHVFNQMGGLRRFVRATLATFLVSALVHEYVFDIPAGRVLGTQFLFFSIQGVAALATAAYRPRGWKAALSTTATFGFNVVTGVIFVSSMNAVFPIWSPR